MPAARISMRQIIEILRLKYEAGLSHERIARACGLSKGVVGKYVSLAQVQGVTWPLPKNLDEARLHALLFPAKTPPNHLPPPLPTSPKKATVCASGSISSTLAASRGIP